MLAELWKKYELQEVLILTDMEPDDLIALHLLMPFFHARDVPVTIVVSMWRKPLDKARFLSGYLQSNRWDKNVRIHIGANSNKVFDFSPIEDVVKMSRNNIDYQCNEYVLFPKCCENKKTLVLSMAPVQHHLFIVKKKIWSQSVLVMYGSFNVRSWLLNCKNDVSSRKLVAFLASFKKTIYYESYLATGENNSVTGVYPRDDHIATLVRFWNNSIRDDCLCEIEEIQAQNGKMSQQTKASYDRNIKVVQSIDACPTQFVNADCGLAALLLLDLDTARDYLYKGIVAFSPKTCYTFFNNLMKAHPVEFPGVFVVTSDGDKAKQRVLFEKQVALFKTHLEG